MGKKDKVHSRPIGYGHITSPESRANIFSRITFWWANRLPLFAYKYILELEHLWGVIEDDSANVIFERVDKQWQKQKKLEKPSFGKALWNVYKWYYIRCLILMLFAVGAQMVLPELLSRLITWTAAKKFGAPVDNKTGWLYAMGMFLVASFGSLCTYQANYNCVRAGSALRSAVITSVYRHSVRLSNSAKNKTSQGNIVNIMSNDAQRLVDFSLTIANIIAGPAQIIASVVLLYNKIGWPALVALGYMLLNVFLCFLLSHHMDRYRWGIVTNSDFRVKITTEIIQFVKVIKLYAWENSFAQKVIQARITEIKYMRTFNVLRALVSSLTSTCPTLAGILMYSCYWGAGNNLNAAVVFASLSYLNALAFPLNYLAPLISSLVQLRVALARVTEFMLQEEISQVDHLHEPEVTAGISVVDADFDWDLPKDLPADGRSKYPDFTLRNLNLNLTGPKLVAVVGAVGSGKSSLCTSLLGEMKILKGTLAKKGTIAYVPQQAWTVNATVRENILFGSPYDEQLYNEVLDACALRTDLKILQAGDQTEIGDRGINLSGGQKQRISIARALYNKADIYILDDPLSAVDAHVAKHLFFHGIKNYLANKLVLLVTNQLQFLPHADHIIVLGRDGHTACQGTFEELMSSNSEFQELMDTAGGGGQHTDHSHDKDNKEADNGKEDADGELVANEARERGSVKVRVYLEYMKAGGVVVGSLFLIFYCFQITAGTLVNWWLSNWTQNQAIDKRPTSYYFGIYCGLGACLVVTSVTRSFLYFYFFPTAGLNLHNRLFNNVIRLPMSFFDVTPLGRIINRFSKDIDQLDYLLPGALDQTCVFTLNLLATLCLVVAVLPVVLAILAPCVVAFAIMQIFYRNTSREIQRIEAITRSAIFAHFSESLYGASSIRAYQCSDRMIKSNERLLDNNLKAFFTLQAMNQWLGVRLDFIGNIVIFATAIFVILFRESIVPAQMGLALSYALNVTAFLNRSTQATVDFEVKLNSVERILESCAVVPEPQQDNHPRDQNWPVSGDIEFNDFKMRYREGLDFVLRGISCKIGSHEKIGIVGRTGAGKSSIVLALFRLVEAAEGNIKLDDVDISTVGLHTLRSRIAIIPQEPVLFSGTLRDNLDPFKLLADDEIWRVLERIQLKEAAEKAGGLYSVVSENGDNWSVGQRQLICLCRALLRKPKLLVLDEASASVDTTTDALIQKTIRAEFYDATILTIAHRLNTIMDSTRIIVMDKGLITEFDTPAKLLDNPESHLNWLVNETGPKNAEILRAMAYGSALSGSDG